MKIFPFLSFFLICSVSSIAQSRFGIGLNYSPLLSNQNSELMQTNYSPAMSAGLQVSYDILPWLRTSTGLWYTTRTFGTNVDFTDPSGNVLVENVLFTVSNHYLEIPFLAHIKGKGDSRVSFYSSVGPVIGIPVGGAYKTDPEVFTKETFGPAGMTNSLSAYAAAGLTFKWTDHWASTIEPNTAYSYIFRSEGATKTRYYSFGLRFGMIYKL